MIIFSDLRCVPSYAICSYALALCTTYRRTLVVAQLRSRASNLSMVTYITSMDNRANLVLDDTLGGPMEFVMLKFKKNSLVPL